jgi:D-arabinose 1-dehydrogenase-like Zn-dependent alcohol dehydrogenase
MSYLVIIVHHQVVEVFPLEKVNEAFAKVMDNSIRFRGVIKICDED